MKTLNRNEGDRSSLLDCAISHVAPPRSNSRLVIQAAALSYKIALITCFVQGCNNEPPDDIDPSSMVSVADFADRECDFSLYDPGVGSLEGAPSDLLPTVIEDFPAWAEPLLGLKVSIYSQFCDDPDSDADDRLGFTTHCGKHIDEEGRIWWNPTKKKWCQGDEDDPAYLDELEEVVGEEGEPFVDEMCDEKAGVVFCDSRCSK